MTAETAFSAAPLPPVEQRIDVLIVGAGPVGLFAAFEAGVLGLSCVLVDVLDRPGGQCTELYPEKPIYDIPALVSCTAQELVDRLLAQCAPFGYPILCGRRAETVETIEGEHGRRFRVTTSVGDVFDCAAVLITAGNGAFAPQRVALPEAAALEGRHLHYAVRDTARFADKHVVVAGGGDSALDWALALRKTAARVTLVHRREGFRAADASVAGMRAAVAAGEMDFQVGMIGRLDSAPDGTLTGIALRQREGETRLPCDELIALYGLVSEPGPIASWDVEMRAGRIVVETTAYETSRAGVFAAGDIALYPNKQKLILSGFHEVAMALRRAYRYANPDKTLVHTHTSNDTNLQSRLHAAAE
ncbi:NAD(P)/FAD-dependent oxidoreductase [Ralstonia nicotianae]|uniref:Ferredoxin--NADP reductase n=1 Tax=Ralstonia nicotianae TaxID=3037696 RepID=A0ABX7ZUL3_9RALS|nr:NAD(P)/FAD-dependent oxidoreductase [Ralstonia nicotianae]OHV00416.1 ferredoxin-NADP reductase [Ralstonia solanacearum]QUP59006.1 NAD(P)-binding protein [Ralstonia nicotianae]